MSDEVKTVSTDPADFGLNVSAADVEKAIVNKELKAEPVGIEESASLLFGLYLPRYVDIISGLSNKSLKRLLYSLVAVPLEEARLNLKNEKERTAYAIAEQLMVSKSALIMNAAYNEEKNQQTIRENAQVTNNIEEKDVKNP